MSAARTARRRRKQHAQGFNHLAKLGRPIYRRRALSSVQDAIRAERMRAQAEQRRKAAKSK